MGRGDQMLSLVEQVIFRQPLFNTLSVKDNRKLHLLTPADGSLVAPIETVEVDWAIGVSVDNSSGPDKLKLEIKGSTV